MRAEDREQIDRLVAAATTVRSNAYAPYSSFSVGAAVLAGGRVFPGANVENASYGMTMCAERSAVFAAVAAGERTVDCVAVVTDEDRPTPPCGACRQVLWEFGPSALVVAESTSTGARLMWALEDLLPDAFGPADLT
jgi:cytidine deaminase